MPRRKNQPASKIEEVKLKDGSLRVGNGPTYLFFLPDGNVMVLQVGHGAFGEYKRLLKNLGAFVEPGPLGYNLILLGVGAVSYLAAGIVFHKRDLPAPL